MENTLNLYGKQRARRSLLQTATFRVLSQVATLLSTIALVRGMSEHDFGVLSLLYAFIPVVSTFASLGLEQTLRRYQPEYLRTGNLAGASWLLRVIVTGRLLTNVLVIGIVLLAWQWVAPIFHIDPYRFEFILFAVVVLLHFQTRIMQLALGSHMLHGYAVGCFALLPAMKFVGYMVLIWQHQFTLKAAILVDTVAYGVAYAGLFYAQWKYCRPPPGSGSFRPTPEDRKRFISYGFYNNFNDAGSFLLTTRSDNFFIAALINPVAVGAYAFYTRLNEMLANASPTRLFENVINPLFFATPPEEAKKRIPRYFTLMINTSLLLQWPVLVFTFAYNREIVDLMFAGKFREYSSLLPMIVAFSTCNLFSIPSTLAAQYAEKARIILFSKVFSISQVVLIIMLLPKFGIYGATIAGGVSNILKNGFIWWHVRDTARWLNMRSVLVWGFLVWGVALAVCEGLKHILPAPQIVHIIMGAAVCGVAWLVYVRTPALSPSDREILGGVLKGKEARILRLSGLLPAK